MPKRSWVSVCIACCLSSSGCVAGMQIEEQKGDKAKAGANTASGGNAGDGDAPHPGGEDASGAGSDAAPSDPVPGAGSGGADDVGTETDAGYATGDDGGVEVVTEPCPEAALEALGITLPACCTQDGQCGVEGAVLGIAGCTPLAAAAAEAAQRGAPEGTIPAPRACPAM
jgi:hypothetical protein